MNYKMPSNLRYHTKKCFPMLVFFFFIIFLFALIYSPYLSAGDTMFKECNLCGHLNYQFSNTCSMCGSGGKFTDVYLKPDCEKRDAKNKKKSKALFGKPLLIHKNDQCDMPEFEKIHTKKYKDKECIPGMESKNNLYNAFIMPINKVLARIIHHRDSIMNAKEETVTHITIESLDSAFNNLIKSREDLIIFHDLVEYRQYRKSDELIYQR